MTIDLEKLEVLYKGRSVGNIDGCLLEIENESSVDLTDVEFNLSYEDGTAILASEGQIVGSTQLLPSAQKYVDKYHRLAALPDELRQQDPDFKYVLSRRDFQIPVLNRGSRAEFSFLVTPTVSVSTPTLRVSCDHRGVKLRNRPLQEMWWREPRDRVALIGLVEAALFAGVAGVTIASPLSASFLAFVLDAICIVFGALSLKLSRLVRRVF